MIITAGDVISSTCNVIISAHGVIIAALGVIVTAYDVIVTAYGFTRVRRSLGRPVQFGDRLCEPAERTCSGRRLRQSANHRRIHAA
jgi:hypothetical protein